MSLMCLALHRTLRRRAADNYEMNRQSEFISLLLKDFESCSSDLLWETDADGKLIYFSDRLPTLVGTESDQLLGKTFQEAAVASPEAEGWDDFLKLSGNRVAIEALRLEVRRGILEQRLVDGDGTAASRPCRRFPRLSRRDPRYHRSKDGHKSISSRPRKKPSAPRPPSRSSSPSPVTS